MKRHKKLNITIPGNLKKSKGEEKGAPSRGFSSGGRTGKQKWCLNYDGVRIREKTLRERKKKKKPRNRLTLQTKIQPASP